MPLPPAPPSGRPLPAITRRQARVIWSVQAAVLAGAVAGSVAGAATIFPAPLEPSLTAVLTLVAAGIVPVDLALAYLLTRRMRRSAPPGAPPDAVAGTQMIVACALALAAALVCCVSYLVGHAPVLLLLVLPCAAVLVHWYPSESRWRAISPAVPGPPPSRRPLVRE